MLSVDIEKIIPVTEARDMFNKIVDEVEGTDEMYVLTKNGKPSAVVVGVNHLEKLTGAEGAEVMAKIDSMSSAPAEAEAAAVSAASAVAPEPAPVPEYVEPTPVAPVASTPPAQSFGVAPETPVEPATIEPATVEPEAVMPNLPPAEPTPPYTAPDPFASPASADGSAAGSAPLPNAANPSNVNPTPQNPAGMNQ